jgi:uncharacterized repeat protein (TIGR03803 family)
VSYRRFSPFAICLLALTCVTLPGATAQTVSILHNFGADGDAAEPDGVLIFDKAGNAYGVSYRGGTYLNGTVYELSPSGSGWNETILHNFNASAGDGQTPQGSLVMDSAGNLYGTTQNGGARKLGIVYKLSPASGGTWTEKIIHTFIGGTDGRFPEAGLIFDKKGNLYGTAYQGGTGGTCGGLGCGVVFELSPKSSGSWSEKILHTFKSRKGFGRQSLRHRSHWRRALRWNSIQADSECIRHMDRDNPAQLQSQQHRWK